jgi:hypothetical protein
MPPTIALCDEWVCNKNEASNPATKDDRKQPDATEKISTTLMWIADVSNKGRIFQERAAPWRKSRPISSRFRALPTNSKNQLLCGVHPAGTTYAEHRLLAQEKILKSMHLCAEAVMPALRRL